MRSVKLVRDNATGLGTTRPGQRNWWMRIHRVREDGFVQKSKRKTFKRLENTTEMTSGSRLGDWGGKRSWCDVRDRRDQCRFGTCQEFTANPKFVATERWRRRRWAWKLQVTFRYVWKGDARMEPIRGSRKCNMKFFVYIYVKKKCTKIVNPTRRSSLMLRKACNTWVERRRWRVWYEDTRGNLRECERELGFDNRGKTTSGCSMMVNDTVMKRHSRTRNSRA